MWSFLKRRTPLPRVDDPVSYVREQIRSFQLPGSDALSEVLLTAPTAQPPAWDAGIYVSTQQSERFYADILEFWVRAFYCAVEDLRLGSLFVDVAPDVLVRAIPSTEFHDEFHSLLCARPLDATSEEYQSYTLTRIQLEGRRIGKAWLMLDRPDIRSAVAESDGEFVAYFGVMRDKGTRTKLLTSAYREFKEALSRALYEEDPAGMGASVGAPLDEYDAEAARLAVALRNCVSRKDVAEALTTMFGSAPVPLIERVFAAMLRFRADSDT